MHRISLDGLFAPALAGGIERAALAELLPQLAAAHAELMVQRGDSIGFYDLPGDAEVLKGLKAECKRLRALADDLVVLGIGGSSLGGQALVSGLRHLSDRSVRVHFLDNVDPDTMGPLLDSLDPERTAAVAITKSGDTVETLAQLLIMRRWFRVSLGQGDTHKRMTFITDPDAGLLRELAGSEGIRSFEIPANVGGRFSALTPVGLLPAAFAGIDIEKLWTGAASMAERVSGDDFDTNPAWQFAAGCLLAQRKLGASALVLMPYSDALRVTTQWFVQLWAESLGKRLSRNGAPVHFGQTPIAAVGTTDQHAQLQLFIEGPRDKVVTLLQVEQSHRTLQIPDELADREEVSFLHGRDLGELLDAERRATRAALLDAGVPVIDIALPRVDEESLGGLVMLLEASCALMGWTAGIDPFSQPGVELGKRMALGLLGRSGFEAEVQQVAARE